MSFTKRYYEAVAEVIGKSCSLEGPIDALCGVFQADNPRFCGARFGQAIEEEGW